MSVGDQRPVALITGASGGIGAAFAHEIAADGYDLVLVARDHKALDKVGGQLAQEFGIEWLALPADLTLSSHVEPLLAQLESEGCDFDLVVNNAGYGLTGAAIHSDTAGNLGSIALNVSALSEICFRFLPGMAKRGRGGIINVGSVVGFFPGPYFATYYATKAYVLSFTKALAYEMKDNGVKICVVCPGATETQFHQRSGLSQSGRAKRRAFMSAKEVAKIGYAGYKRGRTVIVTGKFNQFVVTMSRIIPPSLFARFVAKFNKA